MKPPGQEVLLKTDGREKSAVADYCGHQSVGRRFNPKQIACSPLQLPATQLLPGLLS